MPLPARTFLEDLHFSTSSSTPKVESTLAKAAVFFTDSMSPPTTRGISGTWSTTWPRAMTRGGMAEAAMAEATA